MKYVLNLFAGIFLFSIFYFLLSTFGGSKLSLFSIGSANAAAGVVCQPIYGGGQTCIQVGELLVNKTVLNPQTNTLVDNLGVNDPKFGPDNIVTFQITVQNTGQATLPRVQVRDIFPQFVDFAAGAGTFDQNTRTLTFEVINLAPNQAQTFTVQGKVVSLNQLPQDQSVVCVVNRVIAQADSQRSEDAAQFCIQKQVVGAPTFPGVPAPGKGALPPKVFPPPQVQITPPTGPELIPLIGLIPTGALGWLLRRKTHIKSV